VSDQLANAGWFVIASVELSRFRVYASPGRPIRIVARGRGSARPMRIVARDRRGVRPVRIVARDRRSARPVRHEPAQVATNADHPQVGATGGGLTTPIGPAEPADGRAGRRLGRPTPGPADAWAETRNNQTGGIDQGRRHNGDLSTRVNTSEREAT